MNIAMPLRLDREEYKFQRSSKIESINNFINLIISTPKGSLICDPNFGYTLSKLRFEIFDELEERINYSERSSYESLEDANLYQKRISGSSKNSNTFAQDLKIAIESYEKRLSDVEVVISYASIERLIRIFITATLTPEGESYSFQTSINAWNK